jgi:peptide/nickel transport system substrate-binding protein
VVVEAKGDDFGKSPIGSGPWMFDEWIEGEQIRLVPFADYQNPRSYVDNKGAPRADELLFRAIPEAGTLVAAFETGEVNIIGLPAVEYPNFKDNDDYQVFLPAGGTNFSFFEFATEASEGETYEPIFKLSFDDINVRKAVAHGIDVDIIEEWFRH